MNKTARYRTHLRSYGIDGDVVAFCGVYQSEGCRIDESPANVECLTCLRRALCEFMGYHQGKSVNEIVTDIEDVSRG